MLETIFQQSVDFAQALQAIGDWLTPIMQFFTFLGNEEFYLLVMPILVWSVNYRFGVRVGVLLLTTGSINWIGKVSLHQPRPYWYDPSVKNLSAPAEGFGMPSGHSMSSSAIFGLVAAIIKRFWVTILMVLIFIMVGLSRIYLGVHFTIDVVLGWTLGLIMLWLFLKFETPLVAWFKSKKVGTQILTIFLISIALTLIGAGVRGMVIAGGFELAGEWVANAALAHPEVTIDPLNLDGLITNTGALFGLVCGAIWINQSGGFNASAGPWWKPIVRFLIGLVGIAVFWKGLDMVFPDSADLVGYSFRYLRYTLVGLWAAGIAPWLFIKLGIGER
jgi:membrane-associated phospholipid phosphatase